MQISVTDVLICKQNSYVSYRKRKAMDQQDQQDRVGDNELNLEFNLDTDFSSVPMDISDSDENDSSTSDSETEVESNSDSDSEEPKAKANKSQTEPLKDSSDTPLYVIPPTDQVFVSPVTVEQHLLAVCAYASKYNISTIQFQDLMLLLNLHLPENNLLELDVQKIKEMCGYTSDIKTIHEYCSKCGALKVDKNAEVCRTANCGNMFDDAKSTASFFVSGNIGSQLKNILETEKNWDKVQECHNRNRSDFITDITDGHEYRKLQEAGGFLCLPSNNVTFTFFTDGIPLFKSSKVSLWPVYLVINELPPNERFLRKNMILWGLWQGVAKPRMNTYFKKLITDLSDIYTNGVLLSVNNTSVICKAMLVVLTMDLQARAYVLNMTQHNGECGCVFCEQPGEVVKKGKGNCRVYLYDESKVPTKRTNESIKAAAAEASTSKKRVKGMHGKSVFLHLAYLSLVTNIVVDYMHGCLLGVTKKLMSLWFDSENQGKPFFLGSKVKSIEKFLRNVKPPYLVHRLPRKIENNYGHWKASEFRSWLLFYSIPVLKTFLRRTYLEHYSCLVESIYLLLGDAISPADLARAESLLTVFIKHFGTCYGKENVGMNVHNLGHLVDGVRQWGPLWAYSCFGFESFNGEILKSVHGTGNVCNQIFWSLQAQKHLEKQSIHLPSSEIKQFFVTMLKGQTHKLPSCVDGYQCLIAKPLVKVNISKLEKTVVEQLEAIGINAQEIDTSKKILRHDSVFYSKECSRVKKRNSYTVQLEQRLANDELVVQVRYYLISDLKHAYAVCDTFASRGPVVDNRMGFLLKVEKCRESVLVPCTLFQDPLVYIDGSEGPCIIKMPTRNERD